MRTFQFSDAKSHKFWTIDVQGESFTVTYGKVGTTGQTQTKTFAGPEKAQAEADKLIREKAGKGYVETTAKSAVSDAEAFEQTLRSNPHDLAAWCAYADYLAEKDDPRGEFMQVQIALEDESRPKAERDELKKREKALLSEHEREWLGPFAAAIHEGELDHQFIRGWLGRVVFDELSVAQARALVQCPSAQLLREIVIEGLQYEAPVGTQQQYIDTYYEPGPDVPADIEPYSGPGLHALCRFPHLASIRRFRLGEGTVGPNGEEDLDFNCHISGELAYHLVKQMPNLEELYLLAHRVDANKIFPLPMPNLRVLQLYHSNRYPLERLASNSSLGNLTTLLCHPHALEPDEEGNGAHIRLAQLKAVCRSPHLKGLSVLRLRLTDFGDAGAKEIVESGILKRLRVLDLQGGCISDEGARLLASGPDLKKLEFLNLRSNALTNHGVEAIRDTGVRANLEDQHQETGSAEDDEIPEYLFEGDIE